MAPAALLAHLSHRQIQPMYIQASRVTSWTRATRTIATTIDIYLIELAQTACGNLKVTPLPGKGLS